MEPTLKTGDRFLLDKLSPRFDLVKKGDVVIAMSPEPEGGLICKRIAGQGGDFVYLKDRIIKVRKRDK